MLTDYDVGKFLARRRLLRRRDVASTVQALQIRRENQKTQRYEFTMSFPADFFCRKFYIFCDYSATSLVYPNAPTKGPHKNRHIEENHTLTWKRPLKPLNLHHKLLIPANMNFFKKNAGKMSPFRTQKGLVVGED